MPPSSNDPPDDRDDPVADFLSPETPHDQLFRHAFGRPEHAADELAFLLGADVARHVDWSTLAIVPGTYVDDAHRRTGSDLVYSVRMGGQETWIYLLFEDEGPNDPETPQRVLVSMRALWARRMRDGLPRGALPPPIVPIVLHRNARAFGSHERFAELFTRRGDLHSAVSRSLAALGIQADELGRAASADAKAQAPVTGVLRRVLQELSSMGAASEIVRHLAAFVAETEVVERTDLGRDLLLQGFRDAFEVASTEGRLELIGHLLEHRFGPLPYDVRRRLETASLEELDRIEDGILFAKTLDEVFGWRSKPGEPPGDH